LRTRSSNSNLEGKVSKLGLARNARNLTVCDKDVDKLVE
jgi:hypothetical protein